MRYRVRVIVEDEEALGRVEGLGEVVKVEPVHGPGTKDAVQMLHDAGWTQERIAAVVAASQSSISGWLNP